LTDSGDVSGGEYDDIELDDIEISAMTAEELEKERREGWARRGWLRLVEVEAELRTAAQARPRRTSRSRLLSARARSLRGAARH
jgi:hypothetical protein